MQALSSVAPRPRAAPPMQALVTAETENRLVVVDPASGRIERRIAVATDPEFVAADRRYAVVVSPGAGAVTVLARPSMRTIRVVRGFGSPHIAAISADRRFAYVTDDARGELSVVRLSDGRLLDRIQVGAQAHHIAVSPDGRQLWIGLGESASTVVIVDTSEPARPHLAGSFDPSFAAHDLRFAPGGKQVWVTASAAPDVGVFDARNHRVLLRVPGGRPPQHVAFSGLRDDLAYITSGYGRRIEMVRRSTGRVLSVAHAPYGSFDLDAARELVATSSLLRGKLVVYDDQLRPLRVVPIAPATRDVALSPKP
jgi:DNA-binding beta-propeller fold protein YncE